MEHPPYFQIPKESAWPVLTQVLRRSAIDPEFRQRLLDDPAAAIEEETGVVSDTPGYQIMFVEKPEGVTDMLVLPPLIQEPAELSEEELEAVAGGMLADCSCSQSCVENSCVKAEAEPI